uniref:WD repeat containing planar cell polarity effector n=1 Tax=Xenopus tropicalis TaxID=8364 RepID=A0A6I8SDJ8_XENTR
MSFCLTELYLWSLKNTLHVGDEDVGVHQYHEKKEAALHPDYGFLEEKQQFMESRGFPWILKNKRPEKLRDSLTELEELMQSSKCVLSKWKNKYVCQLLFGSGVLVSISLSGPQLEKVVIDRSLVGKLISNPISDAVFTDTFIILSFLKENKLCLIQFAKKINSPDINRQLEKLSLLDLKVLSYIRTEGDLLNACFSINQPYQIYTVEHSLNSNKEPMADSSIYECVRNKIQCVSVTRVPLRSGVISCAVNPSEDKLVLGCEDSSLILYESDCKMTLLAQSDVLPDLLRWHPNGTIFVVASSQGELQIYDMALSPIRAQILAEEIEPNSTIQISKQFNVSSRLLEMHWAAPQTLLQNMDMTDIYNLLYLRFDCGPVGVLQFKLGAVSKGQLGPVEIISQYIRHDEVDEAVGLLSSMNWNTMGHHCYTSMTAIVNHLLRQRLTPDREAQLEASLGTFYSPTRPLLDAIVLEYRDPISRYARRFFHHLLRYQRFEKAFLLAVDIGARDLFMDIHYLALDKGELALAKVARKKAEEIDAESINSGEEPFLPTDTLAAVNEAFVDLSLVPQAEDPIPETFPSTGLGTRNSAQRSTNRQLVHIENKIGIEVYAESLDKSPPWNQGCSEEDFAEENSERSSSLKVVHFGLV